MMRLFSQNLHVPLCVLKLTMAMPVSVAVRIFQNIKLNKSYSIVITGHDYCDCESGSNIPIQCPVDEVFCDKGYLQK